MNFIIAIIFAIIYMLVAKFAEFRIYTWKHRKYSNVYYSIYNNCKCWFRSI